MQKGPDIQLARTGSGILVSLENLALGYPGKGGKRLAEGITCNVLKGELVSLLGRNGCGKSTLLRTLAGLQDALGGRIRMEGRFIEEFDRTGLARFMGYVSTDVVRVQGLRVKDLVTMGRYPHTGWFGRMEEADREKVREAIELTSLEGLAERDLDELSDGERQRAMIARILAQDSRLLILDEPTAFLDLTHRHEVLLLLGRLAREHGKTIIFSSHDLQLSLRLADKIWLMHGGGMEEAAPEDLMLDGRLEEGLLGGSAEKSLQMDRLTGEISMDREILMSVSLTAGDDLAGRLTERALARCGISADGGEDADIRVSTGEKGPVWIVKIGGKELEFNSIYKLSLHLQTLINQIRTT